MHIKKVFAVFVILNEVKDLDIQYMATLIYCFL
jgi:hypothetical protein